jgi:hypothetical protein
MCSNILGFIILTLITIALISLCNYLLHAFFTTRITPLLKQKPCMPCTLLSPAPGTMPGIWLVLNICEMNA